MGCGVVQEVEVPGGVRVLVRDYDYLHGKNAIDSKGRKCVETVFDEPTPPSAGEAK